MACGDVASSSGEHTHLYNLETTSPTCTEKGFTVYTCSCGNTYTTDEVAALGHNFVNGTCTTCGYPVPVETSAEYFTFTLLDDGTYSIKAKDKSNMPSKVVIPSTYEGKTVTSIGDGAFYGCDSLTSIIIPDTVTSIGGWVFECTPYYENEDNWENKVLYISNNLIEAKTTISGEYAIKEGTKCVADYAFEHCDYLTSVTIPDSATSIGSYAFDDCGSLKIVTIGNGVTSIGSYAFYNCESLISVTIGNSVTYIGDYAFNWCDSLARVNISDLSSWCNISFSNYYSNPLYCAHNLYLNGELVTELVIPEEITSIGNYAFLCCNSITSVIIPDCVTSIGYQAFNNCQSLISVTLSDGVTSIGGYAFNYCKSLTSVTISDNLISIGEMAFCDCSSLKSITIPNSVDSIGGNAFVGCTSLTRVHISDLQSWCNISFESYQDVWGGYGYFSNPLCYAKNLYLNGELVTELVIPEGVTSISDYAFYDYGSLVSVTIPDSVTSIGEMVFRDCDSLTSVTIGKGVTSISNYMFYDCDSLTSITISDSVTSIGNYAFCACYYLTSIYIPNSVISIGDCAFDYCFSLIDVYYTGSALEWEKISIGSGNYDLESANIHFYGINHDVWSVIGTICGTNWDTDFLMTQDSEGAWISEPIVMNAGDEFKVRKNWSWEFNYGANGLANGENIVVSESGTYRIKLSYDNYSATIEMIKENN